MDNRLLAGVSFLGAIVVMVAANWVITSQTARHELEMQQLLAQKERQEQEERRTRTDRVVAETKRKVQADIAQLVEKGADPAEAGEQVKAEYLARASILNDDLSAFLAPNPEIAKRVAEKRRDALRAEVARRDGEARNYEAMRRGRDEAARTREINDIRERQRAYR